jgi:hypothetical protein
MGLDILDKVMAIEGKDLRPDIASSSYRLVRSGRWAFTPETRVQIPLGTQEIYECQT